MYYQASLKLECQVVSIWTTVLKTVLQIDIGEKSSVEHLHAMLEESKGSKEKERIFSA